MTIYKYFMHISKRIKKIAIIPLIIFIIFLAISKTTAIKNSATFKITSPKVAIINHDPDGLVTKSLIEHLTPLVTLITIDEDAIQDAIFYREIDYALTIPKHFSTAFIKQDIPPLNAQTIVTGAMGQLSERIINQYLHLYKTLLTSGIAIETIPTKIATAHSIPTAINTRTDFQVNQDVYSRFNTLALYPIFLTITTIISTLLIIFNQTPLKKRFATTSTSQGSYALQLLSGTLVIGHLLWFGMQIITTLVLRQHIDFNMYGYYLFNNYLFFLTSLACAFTIGKCVKTHTVHLAVVNALSLGMSFLSGVFVPRNILSPTLISFAKMSPAYWNIEFNELVTSGHYTFEALCPPALFQILFTLITLTTTLAITRLKHNKH